MVELLVVGRTLLDGSNQFSIFTLEGRHLTVLARVGAGSEIEEIVLASNPF